MTDKPIDLSKLIDSWITEDPIGTTKSSKKNADRSSSNSDAFDKLPERIGKQGIGAKVVQKSQQEDWIEKKLTSVVRKQKRKRDEDEDDV